MEVLLMHLRYYGHLHVFLDLVRAHYMHVCVCASMCCVIRGRC